MQSEIRKANAAIVSLRWSVNTKSFSTMEEVLTRAEAIDWGKLPEQIQEEYDQLKVKVNQVLKSNQKQCQKQSH